MTETYLGDHDRRYYPSMSDASFWSNFRALVEHYREISMGIGTNKFHPTLCQERAELHALMSEYYEAERFDEKQLNEIDDEVRKAAKKEERSVASDSPGFLFRRFWLVRR